MSRGACRCYGSDVGRCKEIYSPFKLSIAFTCGKTSILGAYFIHTLVRGAMVATWGKFQLQVDLWFPPRHHFGGRLWTSRVHF